jgi:sialic acid synthase SpsE
VKFQTFEVDRLVLEGAPKAAYQAAATGGGGQREMLKGLELSRAAHERLIERARQRSVLFLSTPFDEISADLLEALGVVAFKLPSGELTNLPFLRHVARKGRPMIVSTGMADIGEVAGAVAAIEGEGNRQIVLLHCVSQYPADPAQANLRAMATMQAAFGYPAGYSDHTLGAAVAIAAAALGAAVIEKHFTLDRRLEGPDHRASLEPAELGAMIAGIRTASAALGDGRKRAQASERDTAAVARKSVVTVADVPAGEQIGSHRLALRRPGTGIAPACLELVAARRAVRRLPANTLLQWSDLA